MSLESQIEQWRGYLRHRQAIHEVDIPELEDHLREQVTMLVDSGLDEDEAFLVAVKRMGDLDTLSREFAREHSDRLWKQLVMSSSGDDTAPYAVNADTLVAFGLAVAAALAIKLPALFGIPLDDDHAGFYLRNIAFFALPLLAVYFAWKRRIENNMLCWLAGGFLLAMLIVNLLPFVDGGSTMTLAALHLPIALWALVGLAYTGSRWCDVPGRMDFIRFSGEWFIYYVLIALGGGVLTAFVVTIFEVIGIAVEPFVESWLLPCGATGAVLIAAWLVEAKQSVIENIAPVLARLFTPLFALMLVIFLVVLLWTGRSLDIERELLIAFDLLLVVVVGLLLYTVSARDSWALPGLADYAQVVLLVSALLADAFALWAISARITEFGFSPNRVAALGLNLILLVNLAWSAVLYIRFLRGEGLFNALERWQTDYLAVYAGWAAVVVVIFPPLFRFT